MTEPYLVCEAQLPLPSRRAMVREDLAIMMGDNRRMIPEGAASTVLVMEKWNGREPDYPPDERSSKLEYTWLSPNRSGELDLTFTFCQVPHRRQALDVSSAPVLEPSDKLRPP